MSDKLLIVSGLLQFMRNSIYDQREF